MKILQVCPKYFPAIGGIEEHVKNISERLAKEHELTVFACDPSGKLPREEKINGVLVKRFHSFSPGDAYHISFEMARELKKYEFDIVHGHSYHALPLYFSRNARAKKFIATPHYEGHASTRIRGLLIKLYKPLGRRIFDHSDRIIAVSKYEKQLLLKDFNIAEDKVDIIPNGINLSEFISLEETPREPKTILYVGRLEKYKGVQHIIETLPLLDKEFSVKIAGSGSYKPKLIDLTSKLKLSSRVKFLGSIPHREIPKIYASAGIFIVLSQYECFNIAVAEALATKTPCIVANTSALSEWIDNKNCFGIDYPINNEKLAELITKVIGKKVGDVKLWDWDEVAKQIARLYQEQPSSRN